MSKEGDIQVNDLKTKILATLAIAVFLVSIFSISYTAHADQYDAQINALKNQINQNQAAANQKRNEADTLQNRLDAINAQIKAAEASLSLTKTQISATNQEIEAQNKELNRQKEILKENLRIVYKQGEITPLEIIASSKNLSDFISQQQYFSAIKNKIEQNLDKIDQIKKQLDNKKAELTGLSAQQQGQVDSIASQRTEQSNLLAQTRGDEAKYQQIVSDTKKQLSAAQAAQAASIASASSNNVYGGSGGYPWANAPWPNLLADYWNFYQRQCTSYAVWRFSALHPGKPIPTWWGTIVPTNAKHFPARASVTPGFTVSSIPQVGDIAIYSAGEYGHAMIVESISGNAVRVSQYNAGWDGRYSESTWPISSLTFIR